MYDKILIPLDGSEFAERIIAQVEPLADKLGSMLVLMQVTTPLETLIAETTTDPPGYREPLYIRRQRYSMRKGSCPTSQSLK